MNTNGAFLRVCKFGGTSLCDADSFKKCSEIIKDDPSRRFTVLSAPGKRFKNDIKITDLLYKAYDIPDLFGETVRIIAERIGGIAKGLGLRRDYGKMFFAEIERAIKEGRDCTASRGEYFSALMMSEYCHLSLLMPQT